MSDLPTTCLVKSRFFNSLMFLASGLHSALSLPSRANCVCHHHETSFRQYYRRQTGQHIPETGLACIIYLFSELAIIMRRCRNAGRMLVVTKNAGKEEGTGSTRHEFPLYLQHCLIADTRPPYYGICQGVPCDFSDLLKTRLLKSPCSKVWLLARGQY
jgi:hypothetical protein